jgi:hypothetical protein
MDESATCESPIIVSRPRTAEGTEFKLLRVLAITDPAMQVEPSEDT